MIILGITAPISWNQAAAIVVDGRLIAAVEEERFVGIKHAPRMIATNSIDFCLSAANVTPDKVDAIALGFRSPSGYYIRSAAQNIRDRDFTRMVRELGALAEYKVGLVRLTEWLTKRGFNLSGANRTETHFVPHHIAHAASAFRCSGLETSNILTLDGQGEDDSGLLGYGDDSGIHRTERIGIHQSLGMVYSEVTDILGFKPHSHEGKVMGLAAWGKEVLLDASDLWRLTDDGYRLEYKWWQKLERRWPRRRRSEPLNDKHRNIALTTQRFVEGCGVRLAQKLYERTKMTSICLAGGVALNCDMNAEIWKLPWVEKIFIQPASNDSGTAIGAAFEVAAQMGDTVTWEMTHASWGPCYSNEEIERELVETKWKFQKVDKVEEYVAEEVAKGRIIGWFQGRSEIGPRALGNRSIIAHPGLAGMKDKINKEVKHRESWRPFGPSVLDDAGPEYFEKYCFHPFMVLGFHVTEKGSKDLSQAIHVDNTARPQSVREAENQVYYRMIQMFREKTGIAGVLNTSFNDKDKPMVNTPREAVAVFASTGIDVLAIGDFIISKNQN